MPISPAAVSSSATHGAVVPIAYAVGTGTSNVITFTNIPQGYQDLRIILYYIPSTTSTSLGGVVNTDSSSSYTYTYLVGDGSSASSNRQSPAQTSFNFISNAAFAYTQPMSLTIDIQNYANTTTFKTILARLAADQNGSGRTVLTVGTYLKTNAITSFTIQTNSSVNFATGSTASLFGIRTVGQ